MNIQPPRKHLPHEDLESFMKDNIFRDDDYTLHQLFMVYQGIMRRDKIVDKYCQMSEESLELRMYDWPWLIRSGVGKEARYAKRATHRSKITCAQLRAIVKRLLWRR